MNSMRNCLQLNSMMNSIELNLMQTSVQTRRVRVSLRATHTTCMSMCAQGQSCCAGAQSSPNLSQTQHCGRAAHAHALSAAVSVCGDVLRRQRVRFFALCVCVCACAAQRCSHCRLSDGSLNRGQRDALNSPCGVCANPTTTARATTAHSCCSLMRRCACVACVCVVW